jgi:hypothetical protein
MITGVTPRVDVGSLMQYIRELEVNNVENQKFLALLKSWGRIKMNSRGKGLSWRVVMDRNEPTPYADLQEQQFSRPNRYKDAELPWRGYRMSEQHSEMEILQNGDSKTALIDLVADTTTRMMEDMTYDFNNQLFIDGSTAANEGRIYGLKTFLGKTGNASTAWPVSNTSYAGLDMTPAAYGGAIVSGTWPNAQVDSAYAFWTPLQVKYTYSDTALWPGTTWAANCVQALRLPLIYARNRRGKQGKMNIIFIDATMYADLLDAYEEKQRLPIERGEKSGLQALGFDGETVNFDGTEVTYGSDIPVGEGFGINKESIRLHSMKGQLFNPGKDMRLETLARRQDLAFFGQTQYNPRGFIHWGDSTVYA